MQIDATPVHRFEAAGLGKAPFRFVGFQVVKFQACPGAPIQPGTSCDYCGTGIMNVFRCESSDGKTFKVGCDCIAKVGDAGLMRAVKRVQAKARAEVTAARRERRAAEARRTREKAARARRAATRKQANEFARAHAVIPALRIALKGPKRSIAREFLDKLIAYGSLTPAQLKFLLSLGTRTAAAPTGKVTFIATIESVKARDGFYRTEYKMVVRADEGFRAWMTAPTSLLDLPGVGLERFAGMRVIITATLEPSRDDAGFAFGKRPRVKIA